MRLMRVLASSLAAALASNGDDDARKDEGAGETVAMTMTTSAGGPMMTGTGEVTTVERSTMSGTSGSTGTQATTGPGEGALDDECAASCGKLVECGIELDATDCTLECIDLVVVSGESCLPVYAALIECLRNASCEELDGSAEPYPCEDEDEGLVASGCDPGGCGAGGSSDGVAECSASLQCTGEPVYEMRCEGERCVCQVDGVERGDSCPSEMVCQQDFEMLSDKASRCCGFDLEPDLERAPPSL